MAMNNEFYNIELVFSMVESSQNLNSGNIFVTSKFNSYNTALHPISFNRMGSMDYKGSIILYMKEMIRFVPLTGYFIDLEPKQEVTIKVVENFNNAEYAISQMEYSVALPSP